MKRFEFSLISAQQHGGYAVGMIFSLRTLEALGGQLFVVLIVGRLTMKQDENGSTK